MLIRLVVPSMRIWCAAVPSRVLLEVPAVANSACRVRVRGLKTPPAKARVVMNHSTHADGLIDALRAGAARAALSGVTTFVPGRLSRTKGNSERLTLHVSIPIPGGWRCLARRGSIVQEVFVTTALDEEQLQVLLNSIVE